MDCITGLNSGMIKGKDRATGFEGISQNGESIVHTSASLVNEAAVSVTEAQIPQEFRQPFSNKEVPDLTLFDIFL